MPPVVLLAAGVAVVAFDVEVNHDGVPQIQQSDHRLAQLFLEQAVADNGEHWAGGSRHRCRDCATGPAL